MITEADLRAAAATIDQAPEAELRRKLSELQAARKSRTQREVMRQQSELDALQVDQQAYQEASRAEDTGALHQAADWYRVAAENDFADAQLKLAKVLDSLAGEYLTRPESRAATREEMDLVSDAARWYAAAYAAGDLEAAELLDNLIARHDPRRPRAHPASADSPASADPDPGACALGGLRNVMGLQLAEMTAHCNTCPPCLKELFLWPVAPPSPAENAPAPAPADGSRMPCQPLSGCRSAPRPGPSDPA